MATLPDPSIAETQVQLSQATGTTINADGTLGPSTTNGIELFQRMNGLPPTGTMDPATRAALDDAVPPDSLTDLPERENLPGGNPNGPYDASKYSTSPYTETFVITADQLRHVMPACSAATASRYIDWINLAFVEFEINTTLRVAAFLAHMAVEVGEGLNELTENPGPQGGWQYEGMNGNDQRGDGPKFIGRGALQITGRGLYHRAGAAFGVDLEAAPSRAADPDMAFRIGGWYWRYACKHDLNRLADIGDFAGTYWLINAGEPRRYFTERLKAARDMDALEAPFLANKLSAGALLAARSTLYADLAASPGALKLYGRPPRTTGRYIYYQRGLQLDIRPVTVNYPPFGPL